MATSVPTLRRQSPSRGTGVVHRSLNPIGSVTQAQYGVCFGASAGSGSCRNSLMPRSSPPNLQFAGRISIG